jgi:hypothetical protein
MMIRNTARQALRRAINRNIKYRMMNAESNASQGHQARTPISSTEIRNPSGTVFSVNQDEPKCCPDGIGNPSPCKYSKSQEQLADSQYYAQQGLEQNFMAQAIPSYRQEGSPSEAKVNCFGFGDKAAKQGRNTKECDSYNSDRMSGGDHGNKTSLNTVAPGHPSPSVAPGPPLQRSSRSGSIPRRAETPGPKCR